MFLPKLWLLAYYHDVLMPFLFMLQNALDIIQISGENQMELFSMLAVVLWLGNISFSVIDNENHVEVDSNEGTNFPFVDLLLCKKEPIPFHNFLFGHIL